MLNVLLGWDVDWPTRLPSGIIKVSGNTTENDSYKYFFHEIKPLTV